MLWLAPPCFGHHPGDFSTPSSPWYDPHVAALGAMLHTVAAEHHQSVTEVVHNAGCPVDYNDRPDGVHYSDRGANTVMPALAPVILAAAAALTTSTRRRGS